MTTKEWVVPPRPKPGRKPATDTPPTKRKAQNRAAQRAFRERRAARVGELEEQLEEQREERDKTERELKEKIRVLELDLQSFRSKCSLLENLLERERQERIRVESEAETLRRRSESTFSNNHNRGNNLPSIQHTSRFMAGGTLPYNQTPQMPLAAVSSPSESRTVTRTAMQAFAISQIISPPDPSDPLSNPTDLTCGNCQPDGPCACVEEALRSVQEPTCGKCTLGTTCQCMEETLQTLDASSLPPPQQQQQPKRSSSPSNSGPSGKRLRAAPSATPITSIETDFTNAFKKKEPLEPVINRPSQLPSQLSIDFTPRITIPPRDSCGFCEDGTYCVCAEAAISGSSLGESNDSSSSLPSIFSQESQVTQPTQGLSPPPEPETLLPPMAMEVTSTGAIKLRQRQKLPSSASTTSSKCGPGGPGTCAQCLADPQSGLFCRTLAAINSAGKSKSGGGCCGGAGPGGGCCKSNSNGGGASNATTKSQPISISCADTYKTLASHRNFGQAFEEIGTWLPKLKVVKRQDESTPPGRPAVEIDAASIMTTLKFLDVRFRANKQ